VLDASGKALSNVRTFLLGAQNANALTTASGAISFTDVPIGIYRIRVQLHGYDGATTREFDVLPERAVRVSITLTKMTRKRSRLAARRVRQATARPARMKA
jgi:hypothetical protein